jgi:hypothetical protein
MGYTKLFGSLITSTIWREDKDTKIVWVTMLAMANIAGQVEGTIPGLAAMANLTIPECEAALKKLMSPDPYSRTKDKEGRRIEEIDGGWVLINHAKYREKINTFDREYHAIKQREYRERLQQKEEKSTKEEKTTTSTTTTTDVKKILTSFNNDSFESFWQAYPRKIGKGKCLEWWMKRRPDALLLAKILSAVENQKTWEQWRKDNGQFIPHPITWLNQGRWEDEGMPVVDKRKEMADSFERIFNEQQGR